MRNQLIILSALIVITIWAGINANSDIPEVIPTVSYSEHDAKLMDAILDEAHDESLLHAVETVESHGNANAVSPKGAKGKYQIMDQTAKKPGFGVKPMQNRSQKEQKRLAKQYTKALMKHYEEVLTLAAYNGGVGRVDRALNSALATLPKETQNYVVKVQLAMDEE